MAVRAGKGGICPKLTCACGREGSNGREAFETSEKVERVADGRSNASFRFAPSTYKAYLCKHAGSANYKANYAKPGIVLAVESCALRAILLVVDGPGQDKV